MKSPFGYFTNENSRIPQEQKGNRLFSTRQCLDEYPRTDAHVIEEVFQPDMERKRNQGSSE